jgi:hypothetical protein
MAKVSAKVVKSGVTEALEKMVKRANLTEGYLNRVVYRQYQNAQRNRWRNINEGEDFGGEKPWAELNPIYENLKYRKFLDNPFGHGEKMLIATGRLFFGVVGPGEDHQKIVTNKRIEISTTVPYAKYVDEARTFTEFSPIFWSKIYKGLRDYLAQGIFRELK